jgi:hypothetical protein
VFAGGKHINSALLGPLPVVEELLEAVNLIDKFIVVTGGEWSVWVLGMLNEIGGINMEGETLFEEVGQDSELIPCGIVQPFGGLRVGVARSRVSIAVVDLLVIKVLI